MRRLRDGFRTTTAVAAYVFLCLWHTAQVGASHPMPSQLSTASTRSKACPVILDHDPPRNAKHNAPNTLSRILLGDEASEKLIPYLAAIFTYDNSTDEWTSECSGVLLSPRMVITGAACNATNTSKVLLLGRNLADFDGTDSPTATVVNISSVRPHEKYDGSVDGSAYDVAIVELSADAPAGTRTMAMNIAAEIPVTESVVRVVGYGIRDSSATLSDRNRNLLQVDVPVTTIGDCRAAYEIVGGTDVDAERHVCAGYEDERCGACDGDRGGAVVQYSESGEAVLVGVITTGMLCGVDGLPGIYIRTAPLAEWVREATRGAVKEVRRVEAQTEPGIAGGVVAGIAVGAVAGAAVAVLAAVLAVRAGREWRRRKRAEVQVVQDAGDGEGGAGEPEGPYVPGESAVAGEPFLGAAWGGGAWGSADAAGRGYAAGGGGGGLGVDYSRAGLSEAAGTAGEWGPNAGLPDTVGRSDGGEGGAC